MRVILMTGKGGVGKTSVAAATGLRCAELGYRTLVLSTDPAHSLADSFDLELGHAPTEVRPNLWGAELDALMELEGNWGAVKRYITQVLQAASEVGGELQADITKLRHSPNPNNAENTRMGRGCNNLASRPSLSKTRECHRVFTLNDSVVMPSDRSNQIKVGSLRQRENCFSAPFFPRRNNPH